MTLISKQTAMDIALAYREIEAAEALLKEVTDAINRREMPDIRDAFGRSQTGLQLGVPSGKDSHRLFNVPWAICKPVLETHIAESRAKVMLLTEKAKSEMNGCGWEECA
ncbi:hypothetical protein FB480_101892 [Agrobacterium vitis]|nr:hypothetical protein FB480_101892 [Agrobacterium vitis]